MKASRFTGHWRSLIVLSLLGGLLALPIAGRMSHLFQVLLDHVDGVEGLDGAYAVAVSPDGDAVYVAARDDDAVAVFERQPDGRLIFQRVIRHPSFALREASSVAASPDRRHVYAVGHEYGTLAILRRTGDASEVSFYTFMVNGAESVEGLLGARDLLVTPDNRHVAVVSDDDDALTLFRRDPSLDTLQLTDLAHGFGLGGASGIATAPDGDHLFVAAARDHSLSVFRRDASRDQLAWAGTFTDDVSNVDGLGGAADVAVSPDGRSVYVAASLDDAVAVFERQADSGLLSFVEVHQDGRRGVRGLDGAKSVVVSPDGGLVVVGGRRDGSVAFFNRDDGGRLQFIEAVPADGSRRLVEGLAVSPDAAHLFMVVSNADALGVLSMRPPLFADSFESGSLDAWDSAARR